MRKIKQSTSKNVMVMMVDSSDHVTGKTGLTLAVEASKDGGAFSSISPTVTERGYGWYSVTLASGHTDTLGDLALHITATGADPCDLVLLVEARSVDDVLPTASYVAPLDAAGTRTALGLASANLDTQLSDISSSIKTPEQIASAVLTAANTTPIASDIKKVVGMNVGGSGTELDPWGPA